jgi:hypothetical protein
MEIREAPRSGAGGILARFAGPGKIARFENRDKYRQSGWGIAGALLSVSSRSGGRSGVRKRVETKA